MIGAPGNSRPHRISIPARGSLSVQAVGNHISHRGGDQVIVRTPDGSEVELTTGEGHDFAVTFQSLLIVNPGAAVASCELQIGFGRFHGRVLAGQVQLLPASAIVGGEPVVVAAETNVLLYPANMARSHAAITADEDNPGLLFVTDSDAAAVSGQPVGPGQPLTYPSRGVIRVYNPHPDLPCTLYPSEALL